MTLQYRIRSKFEDEQWRDRVLLCRKLLLQYVDAWCRSDSEFPVETFLSKTLFLFSPRCLIHRLKLAELLERGLTTSTEEYLATWPHRRNDSASMLIDSLNAIVKSAAKEWDANGFSELTIDFVVEMLVKEITGLHYVVFHHRQTTSRDCNHFGI